MHLLELAKLAEMQGRNKSLYSTQAKESQNRAVALLDKMNQQEAKVPVSDRSVKTGDAQLDEVLNTPYLNLEDLVAPANRKG